MAKLDLPAGCDVRLYNSPNIAQSHHKSATILITPPGVQATPANLYRQGRLTTIITCEAGIEWPNSSAIGLITTAIAEADVAAIYFERRRDALICERRIRGLAS